jgi:hypothetical protein
LLPGLSAPLLTGHKSRPQPRASRHEHAQPFGCATVRGAQCSLN